MINNLGTPSSEVQINVGVLQIDTEISAMGRCPMTKFVVFKLVWKGFIVFRIREKGSISHLFFVQKSFFGD